MLEDNCVREKPVVSGDHSGERRKDSEGSRRGKGHFFFSDLHSTLSLDFPT